MICVKSLRKQQTQQVTLNAQCSAMLIAYHMLHMHATVCILVVPRFGCFVADFSCIIQTSGISYRTQFQVCGSCLLTPVGIVLGSPS